MNKITIIGAGRVGESTAITIAIRNLCEEIALLDINGDYAKGVALDIQESAPVFGFDTRLHGGSDHAIMEGSDLIIITAGLPRKPGMSRSDLLAANVGIMDSLLEGAMKYAPETLLLFVTNPVDIVTYHALLSTGWSRNRVFGQAGVLDSSRMAAFIAMETGYSIQNIHTTVLGGHGDSMVPLLRYTNISGIPITNFLSDKKLEQIVERTRKGGAEILGLRQNSSAYNAPAASVAKMVDAIANNRKQILPTVCVLEGEYGCKDLAIGVPAVLGSNGVEDILELDLNDNEQKMFDHSVSLVQSDIKVLKSL